MLLACLTTSDIKPASDGPDVEGKEFNRQITAVRIASGGLAGKDLEMGIVISCCGKFAS